MLIIVNDRRIDVTCPYAHLCWADQFCPNACPDTLYYVLKRSAELEHELEMMPHTDPDLAVVCPHIECRFRRGEVSVNDVRAAWGLIPARPTPEDYVKM